MTEGRQDAMDRMLYTEELLKDGAKEGSGIYGEALRRAEFEKAQKIADESGLKLEIQSLGVNQRGKPEKRSASGENSKKPNKSFEDSEKSDTIKLLDIVIGKSIGAKAKNYDIELPNKEIVHLTEGTSVTSIQTIAGKGRNRQIDEIDILLERFGGSESEWQKKKGLGYVDYNGESFLARLHWYEEPTAGRHKWKVKPDADGNWFIDDD